MTQSLNSSLNAPGSWSAHHWRLVLMIAVLHGVNHAYYGMIPPLFLAMQSDLHLNGLTPALAIGTAYLAPYGAGHLVFGFLADRVRKSLLLGMGSLCAGLCLCAAAAAPSYGALLAAVAAAGLAASSYHGVSPALMTLLLPRTAGRALGISGIGSALGMALTPALSGWICFHGSWRTAFLTFGGMGAAFSVLFLATVHEPGDSGLHPSEPAALPWRRSLRMMTPVLVVLALREFCGWGSLSLVPAFVQSVRGYGIREAGLLCAWLSIAGILANPLFGNWSDRVSRTRLLAPLLLACCGLLVMLPALPRPWIAITAVLFGFVYTATVPILDAVIGDVAPRRGRGAAFGVAASIGIGTGSLAPVTTAAIADRFDGASAGFHLAFLVLAAAAAAAVVPLATVRKTGAK